MEDIKQKILIVDDNPKNVSVLEDILEPLGYELFVSLGGTRALQIIPVIKPDLILLDIMMPDFNGFEVCRILKKDTQTADIPIIFLTAIDSAESKVKAFKMGAVDYICKPFNCLEVMARVTTHLQKADSFRKLEELNRILDGKVLDETEKRLKQQQVLIQQSKMASMGEMFGIVAHQWRQPLNSIGLVVQSYAERCNDGECNESTTKESTDKVLNILNHMSSTIDDFRNFFKPNKQKKLFCAIETVQSVISILSAQFVQEEILIELSIKENCAKIYGYENELKQVILNLLSNAKDAIVEAKKIGSQILDVNKIAIKIDSFDRKEPHIEDGLILSKRVSIVVGDHAGGIQPEIMEKIFELYFTTKGEETGTGIGLYISKVIVEENMHGKLTAENWLNGALFTIELDGASDYDDI